MFKKIKLYLLPILLFIPPTFPWLMSGFPQSDDGDWMIIRLSAFFETLRGGDFPVRFIARLNNGYGYPVSDFLYPLYLYLGSIIHLFGLSFVLVIKLLFVSSFILSGYFCYLWLRHKIKTLQAIIASVFYVYFPYHFWDMNHRGSLGEMLSFAVVPFILWQIERKSIFWTAFGILFLLIAHNTQALLFLPLVMIYLFVEKKVFIRKGLTAYILGFGMSVWFILPAIFDQVYTVFNESIVSDAPQFITTDWLFGAIILGWILLGILYKKSWQVSLWGGVFCLTLFFTTNLSLVFWSPSLLLKYVQFPMRFLGPVMLIGTILLMYILPKLSKQLVIISGIIIGVLAILFTMMGLPQSFKHVPDTFFTTNEDTTTVKGEYMPKIVNKKLQHEEYREVFLINGIGTIGEVTKRGNYRSFSVDASTENLVGIHAVYFPGWSAYIDGRVVTIIPMKETGLITFVVPSGHHSIVTSFTETKEYRIFDLLAVISFVICCSYAWYDRKYAKTS